MYNIITNDNTIDSHLYFLNTGRYFVMWCGSYMYINYLNTKRKLGLNELEETKVIEAKTRIISSAHAILCCIYSSLYLMNKIDYVVWLNHIPMSSGFALFDMMIVTKNYNIFKKGYLPTVLHHILLTIGPLVIVPSNSYIISQSYLFEFTVPILDYNWLLYHKKKQNTTLFKVNSGVSLFSFFVFRILNNVYLTYKIKNINYIVKLFSLIFLSLNINWFYGLIKLFIKLKSK
tara:strand:- start:3286 stop:3981 length:696 start_codon:yes stop_codon:yes gene_type:complete